MMLFGVAFEFRLTRLTPWSTDGAEFYNHVDLVRSKIAANELVDDARVITNRSASLLTVEVVVEARGPRVAADDALGLVAKAIETCDARHFGLLGNDRGSLASAGADSGLVTPIWHKRRILVDVAA